MILNSYQGMLKKLLIAFNTIGKNREYSVKTTLLRLEICLNGLEESSLIKILS